MTGWRFTKWEERKGQWMRVTDVIQAEILFASPEQVLFQCPAGTIAMLHSHPDGHCSPSMLDFHWGVRALFTSGIPLTGVVCGTGPHVRLIEGIEAIAKDRWTAFIFLSQTIRGPTY